MTRMGLSNSKAKLTLFKKILRKVWHISVMICTIWPSNTNIWCPNYMPLFHTYFFPFNHSILASVCPQSPKIRDWCFEYNFINRISMIGRAQDFSFSTLLSAHLVQNAPQMRWTATTILLSLFSWFELCLPGRVTAVEIPCALFEQMAAANPITQNSTGEFRRWVPNSLWLNQKSTFESKILQKNLARDYSWEFSFLLNA